VTDAIQLKNILLIKRLIGESLSYKGMRPSQTLDCEFVELNATSLKYEIVRRYSCLESSRNMRESSVRAHKT
jgi:hypothetical protein